jgi:hypothetical protein
VTRAQGVPLQKMEKKTREVQRRIAFLHQSPLDFALFGVDSTTSSNSATQAPTAIIDTTLSTSHCRSSVTYAHQLLGIKDVEGLASSRPMLGGQPVLINLSSSTPIGSSLAHTRPARGRFYLAFELSFE